MPTYCGIDGVVRKLKEWPVGVSGVMRQQKEVWAGVNGVKRKIFSGKKAYTVKIKNYNSNDHDIYKYQACVEILGVKYTYQDDGTVLTVEENTPVICTATSGGVYINGSFIAGSDYYGYTYTVTSNIEILISMQVIMMPNTSFVMGTIRINSI